MEQYEELYNKIASDALENMTEAQQIMTLEKMNEKQLINSLTSQLLKVLKGTNATLNELQMLKRVISGDRKAKKDPKVPKLMETIDGLIKDSQDIIKMLRDSNLQRKVGEIDRNSTMFKGNARDKTGLSSRDFKTK